MENTCHEPIGGSTGASGSKGLNRPGPETHHRHGFSDRLLPESDDTGFMRGAFRDSIVTLPSAMSRQPLP